MLPIRGDANQLRRAFSNLILNAVQATENTVGCKPEISISTHLELAPDRPKIRVDICDNGRGIESSLEDKVFEPFFTTRATGTGLGLAIVKRIIEQHHGSVVLRQTDIAGACASIVLPTGPLQYPAIDEAAALEQEAAAVGGRLSSTEG